MKVAEFRELTADMFRVVHLLVTLRDAPTKMHTLGTIRMCIPLGRPLVKLWIEESSCAFGQKITDTTLKLGRYTVVLWEPSGQIWTSSTEVKAA
jgi:hypothetical protein